MPVQEASLTVCTVSYSSQHFIEFNWRVTKYLNSETPIKWIIGQNTPLGEKFDLPTQDIQIVPGFEAPTSREMAASYHHAITLNKIIACADTHFLLVIDPDFYIVKRDWIADITQYMLSQRLSFFGAPWHPRWERKYRYFPSPHCMFIDLTRVDRQCLDFTPGREIQTVQSHQPFALSSMSAVIAAPTRAFKVLTGYYDRLHIGDSQDTGYKVHRHYSKESIGIECVQPVFRLATDYGARPKWLNLLLDQFFPESMSYQPKQWGYSTAKGFKEFGCVDATQFGWEEFIWQAKPFGFHLRNMQNRNRQNRRRTIAESVSLLADILQDLLGTTSF